MFLDKTSNRITIFITAGDPSGDVHGARLMSAVRVLVPDAMFIGFGGIHMMEQGLHSVAHMKDLAVTGFWEVAKRYGYFRALLEKCADILRKQRPAVFIPVDYPGFNLRLAAHACQARVPVAWYIAPQLWAWGANRAKKLASVVNRLMVVFPFEVEFFARFGITCDHVGHPLLDDPAFETLAPAEGNAVVMMPGSRRQELNRHVPLLTEVAKRLARELPDARMIVPKPPFLPEAPYQPLLDAGATLTADARAALAQARCGMIKAGTSTLEASLLGVPFSTFYRTSWTSYEVSRRLVTVPSVTMMNLLLERPVVREFIQSDAQAGPMVSDMMELWGNTQRRAELKEASGHVRTMLGGPGAAQRAAQVVAEMLRHTR